LVYNNNNNRKPNKRKAQEKKTYNKIKKQNYIVPPYHKFNDKNK